MVADPTVFNDLRNVHLSGGRVELRTGLNRALVFPAPWTDLLGVYLIRAQGLAGAIVYNSVSREVGLFAVDSSGVAYAFVEYLWTIPAGATSPPRISATDSYDQLIIAHDEPIFPLRQATIVYSAVEATIAPLQADLAREDPSGATKFPIKYRGVKKHLAYIVGWGYGTHTDEDRGEVLRISMPGEPARFEPEHYFLVGTQGDPIIGCGPVGDELAVMKIASGKKLVGYDRATFGIRDLDPAYGLQSARLHVSINDEFHFWSLSGPRMSNGGASGDLGLPLELQGPAPDPAALATLAENGFAYHDAKEREIVYCFGSWGYVLHLKDGQRRWSYRKFAIPLINAGLLYVGGNLGLANITAHPEPGALSYIEPSYGVGDGAPKITVPWTNVGGDGVTTETCEVWVRNSIPGSPWRRKFAGLAVTETATFAVDGFWTTYEVALRYTSGGFAGAGYVSADPTNWPLVSRTSITTEGEMTTMVLGKWQRFDATSQGYDVTTLIGPGVNPADDLVGLSYRAEKSEDGGGSWLPIADGLTAEQATLAFVFANSDSLLSRMMRLRPEGPDGEGGWMTSGARVIAPEAPNAVTPGANTNDGANDHADTHDFTWAAPAVVGPDTPADGPYQFRCRHYDNLLAIPPEIGSFGTVGAVGVGVHATTGYVTPGVDPSSSTHRTAEIQVRVNLGADVSPWKIATQSEV